MPVYHRLGEVPRKRHSIFRRPDGGLYAEELIGKVLNDPALLKSLASAPKPEAAGDGAAKEAK